MFEERRKSLSHDWNKIVVVLLCVNRKKISLLHTWDN
jgi:hypothetical protein